MNDSTRSERSWWIWVLAAVGAAGLLVFAIVAGLVAFPPLLANARTQVASAETPLVLGPKDASVAVAVPAGWLITSQDETHALIATPDRGMTIEAMLTDTAPEQAATDAGVAAPMVETLASGLTVAHGSPSGSSEGAAAGPDLVAAVGPVAGGSVVFVASSGDLERYRAAMASLVEGVQP
ncbi:MAG: hypothetical protein BGO47_02585 [Microbacterium sp. 67-17]|uniref:hypothetical protein n=1 Tax=Microbacterium sp. 67-17 TaxID=1895782 RepID=UPI000962F9DA|nr:hypothetical protein [Microbacterium sp. 67-17]OJV95391.1 MAG: hypothetical protein BGO47_02585 [Microbacterium sp. 67-17]